jgi:hypothetical protein
MIKYGHLINKDITCGVRAYKQYISRLPKNESVLWKNIDLEDNISYNMLIWFNESKIPHFHFVSDDSSFDTSICFYEPRYYIHKERFNKLNESQIKRLVEFINESNHLGTMYSLWDSFNLYRHYLDDNKYKYKEDIVIPDYTQLNNLDPIIEERFYNELR